MGAIFEVPPTQKSTYKWYGYTGYPVILKPIVNIVITICHKRDKETQSWTISLKFGKKIEIFDMDIWPNTFN